MKKAFQAVIASVLFFLVVIPIRGMRAEKASWLQNGNDPLGRKIVGIIFNFFVLSPIVSIIRVGHGAEGEAKIVAKYNSLRYQNVPRFKALRIAKSVL